MIVSMWMTRNPLIATPEQAIALVAHEMGNRKIRRMPVVSDQSPKARLVGIISSTDILHAYAPDVNPFGMLKTEARGGMTTVGEVMTRDPLTTTPDTPIEEVARLLREKKIGALPVVLGTTLVGIITESDIFRAFVSVMGADKGGVRVTFDLSTGEDTLALVNGLSRKHGLKLASVITATHEQQELAVVRVHGRATQAFVDDIWSSGHRVLNVLELGGDTPPTR